MSTRSLLIAVLVMTLANLTLWVGAIGPSAGLPISRPGPFEVDSLEDDLLIVVSEWLIDGRDLPLVNDRFDLPPAIVVRPGDRSMVIIPDEWTHFAPPRERMIWLPQSIAMASSLGGTIRSITVDPERSTRDRLFVKWLIHDEFQSRLWEWTVTRNGQNNLTIRVESLAIGCR